MRLLDLDEQMKSRLESVDPIDTEEFFLGGDGIIVGDVASSADLPKNGHKHPSLAFEVTYESAEMRNGELKVYPRV